MRWNPCIAAISRFLSIYAVAPKTPIPYLRGDAVVTDTDTQRKPCDTWHDCVNESEEIVGPWPDSDTPMHVTRRTTASLIPKRIAHRQLAKILPRVQVFCPKNWVTR